METVKNIGVILAVIVSVFGVYKGLKEFILTPPEDHRKMLDKIKTWLGKTSMILGTALSLMVAILSIWEIILFGASNAPMTRHDVLLVIANLWNSIAYLGCSMAIPLIAKAIKSRDGQYAAEAQT
ncbi:hypothetical protein [Pseudomonas baltica]|uniref:hypothetical protein n=1 Tax=Pseudomonas baltica TaxID=2762576 RepID=UPI00289A8E12|nr:hypothetical protein [Pseudomonas baltica]